MNRSIVLISSALMLALVAGCKSTSEWSGSQARKRPQMSMTPPMVTLTNTLDSALLQPGQSLFTLGPGDALDIELWANPLSRTLTLVGPDGKIYYNLLPGLDVWGADAAADDRPAGEGAGKVSQFAARGGHVAP